MGYHWVVLSNWKGHKGWEMVLIDTNWKIIEEGIMSIVNLNMDLPLHRAEGWFPKNQSFHSENDLFCPIASFH